MTHKFTPGEHAEFRKDVPTLKFVETLVSEFGEMREALQGRFAVLAVRNGNGPDLVQIASALWSKSKPAWVSENLLQHA